MPATMKNMYGNRVGISVSRADLSEKVSVNLDIATLAQIDLLVDQGHYSNRSDFINQAIRQTLENKNLLLDQAIKQVTRKNWFLGVYALTGEDLLAAQQSGEKLAISGYGLLLINEALDDLVLETVQDIQVHGKVKCSQRIREAYRLG